MKKVTFLALAFAILFAAKASLAACGDSLTDTRDGKSYQTVSIGSACWMKENLRFENGVANVQKNNNDVFYTWHDAMANVETSGARGICPQGWHIPTEAEWVAAFNNVGGNTCATINDAWGTYHCPNTSAAIRQALNITRVTYGMKSYTGIYWNSNTVLYWASNKVMAGDVEYIKHVLIDNRTSGDLANSVFTDIVRKSWDAGEGYMYNPLRCVQDTATNIESVTCYADLDDDGYGNQNSPRVFTGTSVCPLHYTKNIGDCNDANVNINPLATEVCGNNIDDNCNGQIDENCSNGSTGSDSGSNSDTCPSTLSDSRDGKSYVAVSIGSACWMAEDLRYETNVANVQKNGSDVYYSWHDAMAGSTAEKSQGICPQGWHIPSESEWLTAAKDASGETCQQINDAWGTYYCTIAGSFLKSRLNINKFTIGMKSYSSGSGVSWVQGSAKPWMSTVVRLGDGTDYIKHAYLVNVANSQYNNYFYTDIIRKSWDDGEGYQFAPLRCVKDSAGSTASSGSSSDSSGSSSGSSVFISSDLTTTCYLDKDKDGYGVATSKRQVSSVNCSTGYAKVAGDCNDNNNKVNPGVAEICGNKIDDNCNGQIDDGCGQMTCWYDGDNDKFGNPNSKRIFNNVSACPTRYVANNTDCNDSKATVNPKATEICGNKIDDNCNGQIDETCTKMTCYRDADNDKFGNPSVRKEFTNVSQCPNGYVSNNSDCNDNNSKIKPGIAEVCSNNIDDNCNGQINDGCSTTQFGSTLSSGSTTSGSSSGSTASGNTADCGSTFVDARDNKSYNTVAVAGMCWFASDLRYEGTNSKSLTKYNNNIYYTWSQAMAGTETEGSQGACPSGWHVPSENEWANAAKSFDSSCRQINDAWSTWYCPTAGQSLKSALNLSIRYAWRLGGQLTWKTDELKSWTSSQSNGSGEATIKYILMSGKTGTDFSNSFFTDIMRKTWDAGAGYLYLPVRCVKN